MSNAGDDLRNIYSAAFRTIIRLVRVYLHNRFAEGMSEPRTASIDYGERAAATPLGQSLVLTLDRCESCHASVDLCKPEPPQLENFLNNGDHSQPDGRMTST